jgi:dihydrofolate synthase/folylpolyglutamate synthase
MTYHEAIEFLLGLRLFGANFGLENTSKLAALAGDPQLRLRFIHVAGTNGKGSTCAFLESIYRQAGLRVGLYTSPHLVSFTERLQINRQPVPEAAVARLVTEMQPWLKTFPADAHPTFFEVVTVMALRWFAEQSCDLVIWETGLGGRLDATNIVTPLASVVTNVEPDHQRWLGETLERIAFEKAGILKPGVPAITGTRVPEALAVIEETARARQCPFHHVTPQHTQVPPLDGLRLPLLGWHQRMNAAVALATVGVLQGQLPVTTEHQRAGLLGTRWAGRLERVEPPGRGPVLLDGAHNAGGAAVLRAALAEHFPGVVPALVLGIMQDKDWELMCGLLAPVTARVLCVPVSSERSAAPADLLAACHRANPAASVVLCDSLAEALQQTAGEALTVIAGSLYLIGEAMELLHLAATPPADEKGLNEWSLGRTGHPRIR